MGLRFLGIGITCVLLPITICMAPKARAATLGTDSSVSISGRANPSLAPLDELMTTFIKQNHVPGAAMAVTRNGKLVYARGFGWADVEAKRPVEPDSLFRLASISKPITSAAILKLVENKKIDLQDKAFPYLGYTPFLFPGKTVDPRLNQITIWELLHHSGGFDRDQSFDPMFRSIEIARALGATPPANPDQIIRYMMGKPLDFDPGTREAYSNFGYCVLGRVIEKASGKPYETFVQDEILHPLGIQQMRQGHTLSGERAKGEVTYYSVRSPKSGASAFGDGRKVSYPYGVFYIEAMDSHGGWLASAPDLVRFASALDDPAKCGILSKDSIQQLFARPDITGYGTNGTAKVVYYGCGWEVRILTKGHINTWHTGLLDGTSTLLVRRWDGLDWAVLFNCDTDPNLKPLANVIDPLVHRAVDAVKEWPDYNLFDQNTP